MTSAVALPSPGRDLVSPRGGEGNFMSLSGPGTFSLGPLGAHGAHGHTLPLSTATMDEKSIRSE